MRKYPCWLIGVPHLHDPLSLFPLATISIYWQPYFIWFVVTGVSLYAPCPVWLNAKPHWSRIWHSMMADDIAKGYMVFTMPVHSSLHQTTCNFTSSSTMCSLKPVRLRSLWVPSGGTVGTGAHEPSCPWTLSEANSSPVPQRSGGTAGDWRSGILLSMDTVRGQFVTCHSWFNSTGK
jgi:hypothetical protein